MTVYSNYVWLIVLTLLIAGTSCSRRATEIDTSDGYSQNVKVNAMPQQVLVFGSGYPDAFALTIINEGPGVVAVESGDAENELHQTLGVQETVVLRVMPGRTPSLTNASDLESRLDIELFSFSSDAIPIDLTLPTSMDAE